MAVPFFSAGKFHKNCAPKNSLKQKSFKKSTESLQVPGNFPLIYKTRKEKRVLPFTSSSIPASLTIEAAFSLSLFLLMTAAVMQPLLWLDRQRKIQTAEEVFCGELSQYAYIEKFLSDDKVFQKEVQEELQEDSASGLGYLNKAAASLWLRGKAKQTGIEMDTVRIINADVQDKDGMICFEMEYREQIPFFPILREGITMRAAARRRAWIGLDGKLKSNGEDRREEGDSEEIMVYVGANMGRYHWYRDCHYISNQYQSIHADQIGQLKNAFGKRYTVCSSCGGKGGSAHQVYITPGGEHYHISADCKAMVSYVRQVPLKEVEHLGACSYCSRRKGE